MLEPGENNRVLDDDLITNKETNKKDQYLIVRPFFVFLLSLGLGFISGEVRNKFDTDGIHWEALISLLLLMLGSVVLIWYKGKRKEKKYYLVSFVTNMIVLWSAYIIGWELIVGRFLDDLIFMNVAWCFVFMVVGLLYLKKDSKFWLFFDSKTRI